MKFLIVDDSPTMRRIVINSLRASGWNDFNEASDGEEALNILESDEIDFVITDWNMPNINGLELTKAIRRHPKFNEMPILMVTTRGLKDDIIEALKARVNNYVVKPFTPQILKEKIESIIESNKKV
ncbi:MAG TPA: response regulator [Bacteroidota bacterium]|nr:response regulator [Candidatus Kapabacteria bacterium]HRS01124.1 response regulator [Bacteroidota bacterium]HRT67467.1 response regulator [Bacteroidota bacterium]